MRAWRWLMRVLILLLVLAAVLAYWAVKANSMPLRNRVPTSHWSLYSHYCCASRACQGHHLSQRWIYRWSQDLEPKP